MTKTAIQMTPGDDTHLTLLMAPHGLNLVTGQDREHLLAFGRAVFEAGKATAVQGKCLHQIAKPQKFTVDSEMSRAFEVKYGQDWADPDWRREAGVWASAWHKATNAAQAAQAKQGGAA